MPGKKYEKIGEGAYGCVIQPSLACANKHSVKTYKNRISKVMLTHHAKKEMKEYALISHADPKKKYYLGKPITCRIKNTNKTRRVIKSCKRGKKYLNHMNETSLLIMENGGMNLSMLANEMITWKPSEEKYTIVKHVLVEFAWMLEGVGVFLKHDIIHHDLKPQNIVYNMNTDRMNFIDFGLMRKRSASIRASRNSTNWITQYAHWSYPLETQFLNRNNYMEFASKSKQEKIQYTKTIIKNIEMDLNDKFTDAFYVLCLYIIEPNIDERDKNANLNKVLNDYVNFLLQDMVPNNYETSLKRSFDTYDTYGLGLSLSKLVISIKSLINDELYHQLKEFSYGLLHPNVLQRIGVKDAIKRYGEILKLIE